MTPYRERLKANDAHFGTVTTTVEEPEPEPTEPEPEAEPVESEPEAEPVDDDPDELPIDDTTSEPEPESEPELATPLTNLRRKELIAIADANNIPSYGTRDQILERLHTHGITHS